MKRKKLYSMLALGMAMTLAVGVPVSAAEVGGATSVDTGNFDNDVKEETITKNPEVEQEVTVGKDESGDVVKVEIADSADASSVIEDKLTDKVGDVVKSDEKVAGVKPTTEGLTETQVNDLKKESKELFKAIDANKILVNLANKKVSIKPVEAAVQNVAKQAADKMAEKLGLKVAENGLMASLDIHIDLDEAKNESAKVTIPFGEDQEKPDPGKFDYFVLHYIASTGEWETLPAEVTADGIIVATFDSFSPVFVVKAEKAQAPDNGNNNNGGNGGSNDGGSSDSGSSDNSSSSDSGKAAPAPAPAAAPANPAVSPKTGE